MAKVNLCYDFVAMLHMCRSDWKSWNVCFDANGHWEFGLKCAVQTKQGGVGGGDPCSDISAWVRKSKLNGWEKN